MDVNIAEATCNACARVGMPGERSATTPRLDESYQSSCWPPEAGGAGVTTAFHYHQIGSWRR
ncbi:hypothetical protein SALB1_2525 [Salinisphaera sp. LB1]|nr:hypothetical protein SALB1_2525 [Salinisphaera sp. LB1]